MAYEFKSPLFSYLLWKATSFLGVVINFGFLWLFLRSPEQLLYAPPKGVFLVVVVTLVFLLFLIIFLRLRRIVITPSDIKIIGLIRDRLVPYSNVKWAAQVYLIAPKMIIIRLRSKNPLGFYLYTATYFIGDYFNINVHESVEYINIRVGAAT